MDDLFEEGISEFINYEKDTTGKKSRKDKKKEKVEKMKADLRDPEQRRLRHQLRRKQDKAKIQIELEGMTEEEARIYLDKKAETKRLIKQRNLKALQIGMPILIDAVYEEHMNEKQNKSLAIQIELIMKSIRTIEDPPGIHLCSVGGGLKIQLQKMKYHYWTLTSSPDNVLEVAKRLNKNPVYLSPDASDQLLEIDPNAAYIIGGLVDRTVMKNASLDRSKQLQIPAVRLPIRQYMKSRKCLNLDHVVMMMCKFKETGDWKVAFDFGAPKRWKKQVDDQKQEKKLVEGKEDKEGKKEQKEEEEEEESGSDSLYSDNQKQEEDAKGKPAEITQPQNEQCP